MNQTQLRSRTHCTEKNLVTSQKACTPPPHFPSLSLLPQMQLFRFSVALSCQWPGQKHLLCFLLVGCLHLCVICYICLGHFHDCICPRNPHLAELLLGKLLLSRSVTIAIICKMPPSPCLVFHINGRLSPVDILVSPAQSHEALKPVSTCSLSPRNRDLKSRIITAMAQPRVKRVCVHITQKVSSKPLSPSFCSYSLGVHGAGKVLCSPHCLQMQFTLGFLCSLNLSIIHEMLFFLLLYKLG